MNSTKEKVSLLRSCGMLLISMLVCASESLADDNVIYAAEDSIEVERWLSDTPRNNTVSELTLFFAKKMLSRPYVAFTLEKGDEERLVVNLQELDCTTLVETSAALAITAHTGGKRFADYCETLRRLRYRGGKMGDYSTRLHYFSEWITDNEQSGTVYDKGSSGEYPFIAEQIIDATFMSSNPQYYKRLKNDSAMTEKIAEMEKRLCGQTVHYIPKQLLNKSAEVLHVIQNGDIIALVTNKKGLEISHVGIACWLDGKLHLLNASSLQHKVILDSQTLYEYQKKRPSQLGIRVVGIR